MTPVPDSDQNNPWRARAERAEAALAVYADEKNWHFNGIFIDRRYGWDESFAHRPNEIAVEALAQLASDESQRSLEEET